MRIYDMINREFVRADKDGRVDGIPVFTAKICRVIRDWTVPAISENYEIPMELAKEWKCKSKSIFLVMYDSKGNYKHLEDTGFEDEAAMERRAERYMNLNLPPECLARLKGLHENAANKRKRSR